MKSYRCRVCDNPLYFENSVCVSCGTALGFSRQERAIVPVDKQGRYVDATGLVWWVCKNLNLSGCTGRSPPTVSAMIANARLMALLGCSLTDSDARRA